MASILIGVLLPASGRAAAPTTAPHPPKDEVGEVVPGSYIVTLQPGQNAKGKAAGLAKDAGGSSKKVYRHALNGFEFKGSAKAAAALARNPNVRTVVPNRTLHATVETLTPGIKRIRADHPTQPDAHDSGFTGTGVRVAILDTGIDLTHPDLVANIDAGLGMNCMNTALPPQDGHGHGTHVAGIVAAQAGNGIGVVGVAPSARLVPFKVLDDTGYGEWSNLLCALDILTGYATDADPGNDVLVANMSLGDTGPVGSCNDGGVRQAICTATAAGITFIAAAGNSTVNASTFIPAAFPEVITVSAMTELDGEPGGLAGCWLIFIFCDDTLAEFSNYGLVVDVTAPGTQVYSSWTGGGYQMADGTSMAAPHVAGIAALAKAANPALQPSGIEALLKATGQCANGQWADPAGSGDCVGKGQWAHDPDGYGEPLVNALRAAQGANGWDGPPTIEITNPNDGSAVSGTVTITASASDDHGVTKVEFFVNGEIASTDTDASDGWSTAWNASAVPPGLYTLRATATDTAVQVSSAEATVTTDLPGLQGHWVGSYGVDGYILGAWNGTAATADLAVLPAGVSYTLERGARWSWAAPSTDGRALDSPTLSERRAATWHDTTQLRLRLTFTSAYSGTLHLYAVDWDLLGRRQTVTIDDGAGPRSVNLTAAFDTGAWLHFPVAVPAGGSVLITVAKTAGLNGILSGVFLGGAGGPPAIVPGAPTLAPATAGNGQVALSWTAPASNGGSPISAYKVYRGTTAGGETLLTSLGVVTTYSDPSAVNGTTYYYQVSAVNGVGEGARSAERSATPKAPLPPPTTDLPGLQGHWVGSYGVDGYILGAWNGTAATADLAVLPAGVSYTLERGARWSWAAPSTDGRALDSPTLAERRAATWHDTTQLRLRLTFTSAYSGTLHLYAVDWDLLGRRQTVTIDDGAGPRSVNLTAAFDTGAWLHFPVAVPAGGSVLITVAKTAGLNGILSGVFLGGAGGPPAIVPGAPTLAPATAGNGQVALSWTAPASNGGSPISAYKVYRGTTAGGETLLTSLGVVTTYSDPSAVNGTTYYYQVSAVNGVGEGARSAERSATPKAPLPPPTTDLPGLQGHWVGSYGVDGYILGAWNGTAATADLAVLPAGVSYTLERGARWSWAAPSTDGRALDSPTLAERRAATWHDTTQLRLRLTFTSAYSGTLHLYAVDWDLLGRRQTVTIDDGAGPRSVNLTAAFDTGAWLHFPVAVPAGGSVLITVAKTAGLNGILSGVFLGGAGGPPAIVPGAPTLAPATAGNGQVALSWTAPASNGGSPISAYKVYRGTTAGGETLLTSLGVVTTYSDPSAVNGTTYYYQVSAVNGVGEGARSAERSATPKAPLPPPTTDLPGLQGHWVGSYGVDGYILGAWNGTAATADLAVLPAGVSYTLERGARWSWAAPSTDGRALDSPTLAERRAATWHDTTQLRLRLTFTSAYSGTLHLYAVDWDLLGRRQTVTIDDGAGPRSVNLTAAFDTGAWLHFPVAVPAGGSVLITVAKTAGLNGILSGVFLGGAP